MGDPTYSLYLIRRWQVRKDTVGHPGRNIACQRLVAHHGQGTLAQVLNINLQGLMVKTKANSNKTELIRAVDALFDLLQK